MAAMFTMLFSKISALLGWFGTLFIAVFVAAWDFIRDAACWPFEQMLSIVVSSMSSFNVSGMTSNLSAWGSLPAEVINVMGLLGAGTAATIISSAIGVRLVMQLIPFVRLGS